MQGSSSQATHEQVVQAARVANMDYVFDGSRLAGWDPIVGKTFEQCSKPRWLMIIGDYTTQYIGDYKHPIGEIPINQPGLNGLTEGFLDTAHLNMENLKNYNFQPTKSPFKAWFSLIGKCPFK